MLPPRLHLMVHDRHMVSLGHDLHRRLRPDHAVPPHIGALGPLLNRLEEKAGRLAFVLLDEAAVREHWREVIGEDAPRERQQVAALRRRRPEPGLLLPHRDGVELVERGGGGAAGDAGGPPAAEAQRARGRREAQREREAGGGHGLRPAGGMTRTRVRGEEGC